MTMLLVSSYQYCNTYVLLLSDFASFEQALLKLQPAMSIFSSDFWNILFFMNLKLFHFQKWNILRSDRDDVIKIITERQYKLQNSIKL